jgi:hypothetical protein
MKKDTLNGTSLFVMQSIWLPKGEWYEWNSGTLINGNQVVDRPFMLDEIPIYVRSGAIIPMQPDMSRIGEKNIDPLILNIFPGKSGKTRVYDDASGDLGYKEAAFTFTNIAFEKKNSLLKATISPIEGHYEGMPETRSYEIRLPLTFVPVSVKVNGQPIFFNTNTEAPGWRYDGSNLTTIIRTDRFTVNEKVEVEVAFPDIDPHQLSGIKAKADKIFYVSRQIRGSHEWNHKTLNFDDVTYAGQTLNRFTLTPDNQYILSEKATLETNYAGILEAFEKHKATKPNKYAPLTDLLKVVVK